MYVTVYDPTVELSTLDIDVTVVVPLIASYAVAPASIYDAPWATVSGLLPTIVISGAIVSITCTVRVTRVAALPLVSVAL